MPLFIYKAKKNPHEITEGVVEAETLDAAVAKVNQLGFFPLEIKEKPRLLKRRVKHFGVPGRRSVRPGAIVLVTRQLADLLDSGLPLVRALEIIRNQIPQRNLKEILLKVHDRIRDGSPLSDALSDYPELFSALYINMVKAGEVSGSLDKVLRRLADFLDNEQQLRLRVITSLAYPLIMIIMGIATVFILLTFVIPRLVAMFADMGQQLPLPTKILMSLSALFSGYWWVLLTITGLAVFYFGRMHASAEGRLVIDRCKLRLPLYGELVKKVELARLSRTLALLLHNGVTIIRALEAVSGILENEVLRRDVERIRRDIVDGSSLAHTMTANAYFPEMMTNMIAVGEEAGRLEQGLLKVAEVYERESDATVKVIMTVLEPATILVVGALVGFIVISMLLPIFQMNLIVQ